MKKRFRYAILAALAVLLLALMLSNRVEHSAAASRIAFIYRAGRSTGVYAITPDGSERERLAASTAAPDWFDGLLSRFTPSQQARLRPVLYPDTLNSPTWLGTDGAVGFQYREVGQYCEWVARTSPKAPGEERLACLPAGIRSEAFAWAPDGSRFAFASKENEGTSIRVIGTDGQSLHHWVLEEAVWGLAFSPDSALLAVTVDADQSFRIYGPDGPVSAFPLPDAAAIGRPAWAPDGQTIAFFCITSELYLPRTDICSIGLDGGGYHKITLDQPFPYIKKDLQWSPAGDRLSFVAVMGSGFNDIILIDPDGGNPMLLTTDPAGDSDPAWSPDGSMLVFASNRDGNWELYTIRSDGSMLTRLTDTPGDETEPVWAPGR